MAVIEETLASSLSEMQESLNKISDSTANMEGFLSGSVEEITEGDRAQKIRDAEQKKQTGFLAGLSKKGKDDKDERGFFSRHWKKLLVVGLALFALMKIPLKTFAQIEKQLKEMMKGMNDILNPPKGETILDQVKKKMGEVYDGMSKGEVAAATVGGAYLGAQIYNIGKSIVGFGFKPFKQAYDAGKWGFNKAKQFGKWGGSKFGFNMSGSKAGTQGEFNFDEPDGKPKKKTFKEKIKNVVNKAKTKTKELATKVKEAVKPAVASLKDKVNLDNVKKLKPVAKKLGPIGALIMAGDVAYQASEGATPKDIAANELSSLTFGTVSPSQIKESATNTKKYFGDATRVYKRDFNKHILEPTKQGLMSITKAVVGGVNTLRAKLPTSTPSVPSIKPMQIHESEKKLSSLPAKVREQIFIDPTEFGRQPTHKLKDKDYNKIFKSLAMAESSGNISAVNDRGYVGKYQFGAAALETVGYLKQGTWKNRGKKGNASLMANSNNWIGGTDAAGNKRPSSLAEYISNEKMQDRGMYKLSQINRATLIKELGKDVWEGLTKHERAFMIGGSHLSGATSMAGQFKSGSFDTTDAYGTTSAHHGMIAAKSLGAAYPNQSGNALEGFSTINGVSQNPGNVTINSGNTTINKAPDSPAVVTSGSTSTDPNQYTWSGGLAGWIWRKWNN